MQVNILSSKETSSEVKLYKFEELSFKDGLTAGECILEEKEEVKIFCLF